MNKKSALFFAATLGIAPNLFAGTMGEAVANPVKTVMALSFGPAWYQEGKTQTFFLQSDIEKTYSAYKKSDALGMGEFFYGRQKLLTSRVLGQIGLAFVAAGAARLSGDIWEDADPDFNNYYYNYKISHAHLTVKGKLIAEMGTVVEPYLSGSVGLGLNRSYGFKITPKIFEEVPAPAFTSYTQAAFSYTLGAGLQRQLNENWSAGIGYELGDWGKSKLLRAPGQTLNDGLRLSHLYTNQLQFTLSYVA